MCHLHVDLILFVSLLAKPLRVHVWWVILEVHQTVDLNVSLIQNVQVTLLASEKNAVTPAQDLVVQEHNVMSSITHQYAVVQ